MCSAFHYEPKYSLGNPARSRIRVFYDEEASLYVPVIAGPHTVAGCEGRVSYRIGGKDYEECSFCGASCPSRSLFKEPDSGLPLKCDMCGDPPPTEGPLCAAWCQDDALVYVERTEEEVTDIAEEKDIETAMRNMLENYGRKEIKRLLDEKYGSRL